MMSSAEILNDPEVDAFLSNPEIKRLHEEGNLVKISNLAVSLGNIKKSNALRSLGKMVKQLQVSQLSEGQNG